MPQQAKNWCFTVNSPTDQDQAVLENVEVSYIVWQYEQGTNVHIQGYVQFPRRLSLRQVKDLLISRAHYEVARGSAEDNKAYCTKPETRLRPGGERGTISKQGARHDLVAFRDAIKSGANDALLINEHFNEYAKYHRVVERVRMAFRPPRTWEMDVTVYWGRSGSGKTRRSFEEAGDSTYFLSKGDSNQITWWDGYEGQNSVVIDDFYGWLPWSFILRLLDRYPFNVQVKGGSIPFTSRRIFITSNSNPNTWYKNVPNNDMTPLLRRINKIEEMN